MIVCCLERGCLHKVRLSPREVAALIDCILSALDTQLALRHLAVGIWSAVEVRLTTDSPPYLLILIHQHALPTWKGQSCRAKLYI